MQQDGGGIYDNLDKTKTGFVNNGIMALFSSAQYIIGTTKKESIDNDVDIASTIIGLARYSDDFIKSAGHSMMFAKYQNDFADQGIFTFARPNKHTAAAELADVGPVVMGGNLNYNPGFATL